MMIGKCGFGLAFCGTLALVYLARYADHIYGHWTQGLLDNYRPPMRQRHDSLEDKEVCQDKIQWHQERKTTTSLEDWTFKTTSKCPQFSLTNHPKLHQKVSLDCTGHKPRLIKSWTNSSQDIFSVNFGDTCLARFIDHCCKGSDSIPNVVHYVWITNNEMSFFYFLSFMSVVRFVKPCLFVIHGEYIPKGKYWNYCIRNFPNVIHVKRIRPTSIFTNSLAYPEHSSDVMRIEALREYGGIYLDHDQLVLRSLEPLRKHPLVMGHEQALEYLACSFIMSKKGATFLELWYERYKTDYRKQWSYNCLVVPAKLSVAHPGLIHVEGFNFTKPDWRYVKQLIFNGNYDWSTNYGMHLVSRLFEGRINTDIIRRMNTTLGSVSRHILFGNKEICEK